MSAGYADFVFMDLPDGVISNVLSALPVEQLLNASMVCKAFATLSDKLLEELCKARRWALPRFPRGQSATTAFPWRSLYRQHACIACGKIGEFPLRRLVSGHTVHLICKRCTAIPWVQKRLVRENLFVDLEGVSGKKLLSKGQTSKKRRLSAG